MTPLRQAMIQTMRQHGFSPQTQKSYLYVVADLARYYRRSPDQLEVGDLQTYFNYLVQERSLAPASCRLYLHGIRFLYLQVLHWADFDVNLVLPKRPQRIPELLTRQDVARIVGATKNPKHRALLLITYGCGLRVSEAVSLQVKNIDGERHLLHIHQGKGGKDRMVPLTDVLLDVLRAYWCLGRPVLWLFPSEVLGWSAPDRHHGPEGLSSRQATQRRAKTRRDTRTAPRLCDPSAGTWCTAQRVTEISWAQ